MHNLCMFYMIILADILEDSYKIYYERMKKITGNSIVYWSYHKIDRTLCTCPTSITIK